ncbi:RNase H domain-containing protein [Trichonephila clavipes]|nr:RNase H domain-containing protein [Trichonephila clavipes]
MFSEVLQQALQSWLSESYIEISKVMEQSLEAQTRQSLWAPLGQLAYVRDRTGKDIFKILKRLSISRQIHFPSHVNIAGNEIADSLARAGAGEITTPATPLTYLELFSKYKAKNKANWMIPPVHSWYQSKYHGGSLVRGSSRGDQTALIRFLSGHLMSLTFVDGIKHFEICTKCSKSSLSSGLPWQHFILFGAYQAGLGSRSPIGFGLLQSEWTLGPDLALLITGMRNNNSKKNFILATLY